MSRDDGFTVMDVDTGIVNDPKFKRLCRLTPELYAAALVAYVALLGDSWRLGRRVTIEDAWPPMLPWSDAVVASLRTVDLIDASGFVVMETWSRWYGPAADRQKRARARWARYNAKRNGETTEDPTATTQEPRGSDAGTATSVRPSDPSVPTEGPPTPTSGGNGSSRTNGTNPRAVAAALTRANEEAAKARKSRVQARYLAYSRGQITEAQRIDMDERDAPLSEISYQGVPA